MLICPAGERPRLPSESMRRRERRDAGALPTYPIKQRLTMRRERRKSLEIANGAHRSSAQSLRWRSYTCRSAPLPPRVLGPSWWDSSSSIWRIRSPSLSDLCVCVWIPRRVRSGCVGGVVVWTVTVTRALECPLCVNWGSLCSGLSGDCRAGGLSRCLPSPRVRTLVRPR